MARYRHQLPQLTDGTFLADGGLETTLVFLNGVDLPYFAAFPLAMTESGCEMLASYFRPYLETARKRGIGFIFDTPTWRANADWGQKLGFSAEALANVQRASIAWAARLRDEYAAPSTPIVLNGVIGPRGDGYKVETRMTSEEAERYHSAQIEAFRDTQADMVSAITMNYPEEAIGIARAAQACKIPVVISFTVETDGCLPSGDTVKSAIEQVEIATGKGPAYYMINCAHPDHFNNILATGEPWLDRIRGVRANASRRSHAELDEATELDPGNPAELGQDYRALRHKLKGLCVVGGCCGTDHRHMIAICEACDLGGQQPSRLLTA